MLQGLPSELLYEVLSNLAGDTKALSACALTCQALSLPSRTILFAAVELHLHAAVANLEAPHNLEPPREAKLLKVLQQNPKFILLVQDVSIYDLFGGEELIVADPELNSDVVENIFDKNDSALQVLGLLKYARRLMVFAYNTRSWTHLNPEIQSAIYQAFQYPQVEWIEIHAMSSFPVPLLECCADSLKHVSISTYPTLRLAYPDDTFNNGDKSDALHLKSLALLMSTPNLERFVDWIPKSRVNLKELERLTIRTLGDKHKGVQPLVWKLVGECSATLKDLDFFAYLPYGRTAVSSESITALYDTIDLGRLTALQNLTVRYWLSNLLDTNGQLSLLARLLRTVSGAVRMEHLTLHFLIIHTRIPLHREGSKAWEILDEVISEYAPHSLRLVTVQLEGIPDQERHVEAVGMIENGLARLGSRNLLKVQALYSSPRFIPFSR